MQDQVIQTAKDARLYKVKGFSLNKQIERALALIANDEDLKTLLFLFFEQNALSPRHIVQNGAEGALIREGYNRCRDWWFSVMAQHNKALLADFVVNGYNPNNKAVQQEDDNQDDDR
jgi:hypothetical protein